MLVQHKKVFVSQADFWGGYQQQIVVKTSAGSGARRLLQRDKRLFQQFAPFRAVDFIQQGDSIKMRLLGTLPAVALLYFFIDGADKMVCTAVSVCQCGKAFADIV